MKSSLDLLSSLFILSFSDNLDFIAGGTATRLALNKTIEEIVPEARKDSKRALFLITDGRSNIGGDPSADAAILRDFQKFEIYAIGVTDSVNEKELRSIASEPFRTHVYRLKDFDDLAKLKQLITAKGNSEYIFFDLHYYISHRILTLLTQKGVGRIFWS